MSENKIDTMTLGEIKDAKMRIYEAINDIIKNFEDESELEIYNIVISAKRGEFPMANGANLSTDLTIDYWDINFVGEDD
jgi:TATA-box binding protein (TBP) (component of TFIID and TFIIIB)